MGLKVSENDQQTAFMQQEALYRPSIHAVTNGIVYRYAAQDHQRTLMFNFLTF